MAADELLRGGNGHGVQKLPGSVGVVDGTDGLLGIVGFVGESTMTGGWSGVVGVNGSVGVVGFEIGTNGDDGELPRGGIFPVTGYPPPGPFTGT